jgi:O-antigen biosynthesis protein WbqP
MKRFFDIFLSLLLIPLLLIPMLFVAVLVHLTSSGPVIYWSDRVGRDNIIFQMPKFRSMSINAPSIATHIMSYAESLITPVGRVIRRYSLDELPQLFLILSGKMSFVGPRPALFNQADLITLRKDKGIDKLIPGVTGWAQINGRDDLSIHEKVTFDAEYLKSKSFWLDLKILYITFIKVIKHDNITH